MTLNILIAVTIYKIMCENYYKSTCALWPAEAGIETGAASDPAEVGLDSFGKLMLLL